MSEARRATLPDRRTHEVIEFDHRGVRSIAGIGRFLEGELEPSDEALVEAVTPKRCSSNSFLRKKAASSRPS